MRYIHNPSLTGKEPWNTDNDDFEGRIFPDMDNSLKPLGIAEKVAKTPQGRLMQLHAATVLEQFDTNNAVGFENKGNLTFEMSLISSARKRILDLIQSRKIFLDENGNAEFAEETSPQELQGMKQAVFDVLSDTPKGSTLRERLGKLIEEIDKNLARKTSQRNQDQQEEAIDRRLKTSQKEALQDPYQKMGQLIELAYELCKLKRQARKTRSNKKRTDFEEKILAKSNSLLKILNLIREKKPDLLIEALRTFSMDQASYKRVLTCYLETHNVNFSEQVLQESGINYSAAHDARYEVQRGEKTFAQIVKGANIHQGMDDNPSTFFEKMKDLTPKRRGYLTYIGPYQEWKSRKNIQGGSGNSTLELF